jgi:tetratricopeptide (TPR) repeat protein
MFKSVLGFGLSLSIFAVCAGAVPAQDTPAPRPTPPPAAMPVSAILENAFAHINDPISREDRERAYAKVLEGQRFIENAGRSATRPEYDNNVKFARQAFQDAIQLDPSLIEAYMAIADYSTLDEAIKISGLALKINKDSVTAHRLLGRIYTLRARLTESNLDKDNAEKAIAEWKEVTRLDPRGSEGWAYLSELYDRTNRNDETIQALNKWIGSVAPASRLEYEFFRKATGGQDISPEAASTRLARALLKADRNKEAIDVIAQRIADEPDDEEAIDLLKQALEKTGKESTAQVMQSLQQAIYANPANTSLVEVLASLQARSGAIDDAARTLQNSIDKTDPGDKAAVSRLQLSLGDLYADSERPKEAIAAYEAALKTQGIGNDPAADESGRFFASQVYSSIIQLYKNSQQIDQARAVIERSRNVFGRDDPYADLQLIKLLRDTGRKAEALKTVRALRVKVPTSDEYFYQEAYILTDLGRVEEAVAMIKAKIVNKTRTVTSPQAVTRDINNYLTISMLYSQAKQGPKAVDAAQTALALAQSDDLKQIVLLTLATAQNSSGEFAAAEKTLREILAKNPENATALNNLAYFLTERGEKLEEALQMSQKALRVQPDNSSFLDTMGWVQFKLGKYDDAETSLKQASRQDAASSTILDHLGDVYAKQGKLDLARITWERALNLTSDNAEVAKIKAKLVKKPAR